jgi:crossover junction endodeoxyribonuclease RusA
MGMGRVSEYLLPLPYAKPPLTLNQRLHWRHRDRITREIREHIGWTVRGQEIPAMSRAEITLHYAPDDRRRRDVDNLIPTSKAAVDAVVQAGILPDDTPEYVDHRMPVIEPPGSFRVPPAAVYLVVRDLS